MAGMAGAEEGEVEVVDQVIIVAGGKVLFVFVLYLLLLFELQDLLPHHILSFTNN